MGSVGWSSDIGTERGLPYTAALLMYTNLLTPERADAWSMFTVPSTFVWASVAGSSVDRSTLTCAAQCTTTSTPLTAREASPASLMSPSAVRSFVDACLDGAMSSPETSHSPAIDSHMYEPSCPDEPVT